MYVRTATYGVTGLIAILVGACGSEHVSCSSTKTIDAVKRKALDLTKLKEGFEDIDVSRSTTDVTDIKPLQTYAIEAYCTAKLSQHLRFAVGGDKSKAERAFTLPIRYDVKQSEKDVNVTIYGAIVPPDICAFLSRYTKDLQQGWRAERVPQRTAAFTVKHEPSGMSCGGSDLYKDLPSISCGSLPGDLYFSLPSTWETLDREATACLTAEKFNKVRDEPYHKGWSKKYDASHELNISWNQEKNTYTLNLKYSNTK